VKGARHTFGSLVEQVQPDPSGHGDASQLMPQPSLSRHVVPLEHVQRFHLDLQLLVCQVRQLSTHETWINLFRHCFLCRRFLAAASIKPSSGIPPRAAASACRREATFRVKASNRLASIASAPVMCDVNRSVSSYRWHARATSVELPIFEHGTTPDATTLYRWLGDNDAAHFFWAGQRSASVTM
jgi:hypothetical protein